MKITFIGHASILVETSGVTVLSDPWWKGPCFGAQWWNYPFPHLSSVEKSRIDYIYISHGHHDHFHPSTLNTFDKKTKIVVAASIGLAPSIRSLGFEVVEVDDSESIQLGDSKLMCRIMKTHGSDTLMTLDDGVEVCLNLNDALHSASAAIQDQFIRKLKLLHPKIDYVFCGYGTASHFPNCYIVPRKNRKKTATLRQQHFNRQWARLIFELSPRYGFPFAADVVLLEEDLIWVNESIHNAERPTDALSHLYPDAVPICIDIAPGFVIENGSLSSEVLRAPILESELRVNCKSMVERANRYGTVDHNGLGEIFDLLRSTLHECADYLQSYLGNYSFLIAFRNSCAGIAVEKHGSNLKLLQLSDTVHYRYDIKYTTRLSYLKWALTQPFGDEILFIGSGGIFEYAAQCDFSSNLHRELISLIRKHGIPDRPLDETKPSFILSMKKTVKRLLGRSSPDLYDLTTWTILTNDSKPTRA